MSTPPLPGKDGGNARSCAPVCSTLPVPLTTPTHGSEGGSGVPLEAADGAPIWGLASVDPFGMHRARYRHAEVRATLVVVLPRKVHGDNHDAQVRWHHLPAVAQLQLALKAAVHDLLARQLCLAQHVIRLRLGILAPQAERDVVARAVAEELHLVLPGGLGRPGPRRRPHLGAGPAVDQAAAKDLQPARAIGAPEAAGAQEDDSERREVVGADDMRAAARHSELHLLAREPEDPPPLAVHGRQRLPNADRRLCCLLPAHQAGGPPQGGIAGNGGLVVEVVRPLVRRGEGILHWRRGKGVPHRRRTALPLAHHLATLNVDLVVHAVGTLTHDEVERAVVLLLQSIPLLEAHHVPTAGRDSIPDQERSIRGLEPQPELWGLPNMVVRPQQAHDPGLVAVLLALRGIRLLLVRLGLKQAILAVAAGAAALLEALLAFLLTPVPLDHREHLQREGPLGGHIQQGEACSVCLRVGDDAHAFEREAPPGWEGQPADRNDEEHLQVSVREPRLDTSLTHIESGQEWDLDSS
mmetsp:Transcript_114900/g.320054  ORF Transcript_114900/g.320054 Transcript_114900/m.320054 type:complete len:524 (+) Transcript_114900:707-2278(+)